MDKKHSLQKTAPQLRRGHVILAINGDMRVPTLVVLAVRETADNRTDVIAWDQSAHQVKTQMFPNSMFFSVEAPETRATDAEIDLLVEIARDYLETDPAMTPALRANLEKIVDRLAPVKAPTLVEALDVLAKMAADGAVGTQLNAAERLLTRARRAGVLQ